ncbi:MAG: DUF2007 domain-containing protein [Chryseobacterium sp.]|nr:MAG: DUF2007 domain-containing protein [Chryseobacterium sp.]
MENSKMPSVVLKTFDNYFSANITLTRLQDAGITCYLMDENSVTIYPVLGNAIGGIKLAVLEKDASDAQLMLDRFEDEYMKAAICPKCGHAEFISVPLNEPRSIITSILTWLFSNYAVPSEYVYKCGHCRYETKSLPENFSPPAEPLD